MKPLLYVYRVLLTGIHLMRTGRIEANLVAVNGKSRLRLVRDLSDLTCGSLGLNLVLVCVVSMGWMPVKRKVADD